MTRHECEQLLRAHASGTLSDQGLDRLNRLADTHIELADLLGRRHALRDCLDHPVHRQRLLDSLIPPRKPSDSAPHGKPGAHDEPTYGSEMARADHATLPNRSSSTIAWIGSLVGMLFVMAMVVYLVDEAGDPLLLDPDHPLELPPPPPSMYTAPQTTQRIARDRRRTASDATARSIFYDGKTPTATPATVVVAIDGTWASTPAQAVQEPNPPSPIAGPSAQPLSLRYSVLTKLADGPWIERPPSHILSPDEALSLVVEVNQPAYLRLRTARRDDFWSDRLPANAPDSSLFAAQPFIRYQIMLDLETHAESDNPTLLTKLFVSRDANVSQHRLTAPTIQPPSHATPIDARLIQPSSDKTAYAIINDRPTVQIVRSDPRFRSSEHAYYVANTTEHHRATILVSAALRLGS